MDKLITALFGILAGVAVWLVRQDELSVAFLGAFFIGLAFGCARDWLRKYA